MKTLSTHNWPSQPDAHVWTAWKSNTARQGTRPATQSRTCVHPHCGAVDTREVPNA